MIRWFLIGGLVGIFLKEFFKQLQSNICFWKEIDAEVMEEIMEELQQTERSKWCVVPWKGLQKKIGSADGLQLGLSTIKGGANIRSATAEKQDADLSVVNGKGVSDE